MTMIVGCHFKDGAVIVADSRVTSKEFPAGKKILSDTAQKIIPLGLKLAIAFAGDVPLANDIIFQIRKRITKNKRLRIPSKIATDLPRVAQYCYRKYKETNKNREWSVSLLLGAINPNGTILLWAYESPSFNIKIIRDDFVVLGSGAVVFSYLKENYPRISKTPNVLKDRANQLMIGLDSELQKHGIDTVGGLFQIILLTTQGISPMTHGFMDLDPRSPGYAKEITIQKGRWVQTDLKTATEIKLFSPLEITRITQKEERFYDYEMPKGGKKEPFWYLNYFITCLKTERDVLKTEFEGVFAQSAAVNYPISIPITASLGFWGSAGDHELLFRLDSSTEITTIHKKAIHIEYMPEQFEIDSVLMLKISEPGPVFLECLIDGQFLGRKALYFGKLAQLSFKNEKESSLFIEQSLKEFIEEHRKCNDSILNNRKAILDFYVLCEDCNCVGTKYTFLKEIKAVYWKSYPLSLKLFIATALRSCKGEHSIHIDLVNAATRETSKVTSTHFTSTSDCIVTPILGESIVKIPNPGLYFLNIHVDDEFVGSIILPAENDKPKYSYSLLKEDLSRIQSGELLALLKRAPLKGEKSLK